MFYRVFLFLAVMSVSDNSFAQDVGAQGGFGSLIPLVLIFAIFYFFIIRPQSKKIKEHARMVASLSRGDKIITSGGIEGSITKVDDNSGMLEVEIAKGVKVRVVRSTVSDISSRNAGQKTDKKAA